MEAEPRLPWSSTHHGVVVSLAVVLEGLQFDALTLHQAALLVVVSLQVVHPARQPSMKVHLHKTFAIISAIYIRYYCAA